MITNIFGYAAMTLLVVSFLPKKLKMVRIINLIACLLFVVYGTMLAAWPIVISNVAVSLVQAYHLFIAKKEPTTN